MIKAVVPASPTSLGLVFGGSVNIGMGEEGLLSIFEETAIVGACVAHVVDVLDFVSTLFIVVGSDCPLVVATFPVPAPSAPSASDVVV